MVEVCQDFLEIVKYICASKYDFTMWTDNFNGNVGIYINADNKAVDICQYMSPISDGSYVPIGLNIMYKNNGIKTYEEGGNAKERWEEIVNFLQK